MLHVIFFLFFFLIASSEFVIKKKDDLNITEVDAIDTTYAAQKNISMQQELEQEQHSQHINELCTRHDTHDLVFVRDMKLEEPEDCYFCDRQGEYGNQCCCFGAEVDIGQAFWHCRACDNYDVCTGCLDAPREKITAAPKIVLKKPANVSTQNSLMHTLYPAMPDQCMMPMLPIRMVLARLLAAAKEASGIGEHARILALLAPPEPGGEQWTETHCFALENRRRAVLDDMEKNGLFVGAKLWADTLSGPPCTQAFLDCVLPLSEEPLTNFSHDAADKWVARKSNGIITTLFDRKVVDERSVKFAASAVFVFEGLWLKPFTGRSMIFAGTEVSGLFKRGAYSFWTQQDDPTFLGVAVAVPFRSDDNSPIQCTAVYVMEKAAVSEGLTWEQVSYAAERAMAQPKRLCELIVPTAKVVSNVDLLDPLFGPHRDGWQRINGKTQHLSVLSAGGIVEIGWKGCKAVGVAKACIIWRGQAPGCHTVVPYITIDNKYTVVIYAEGPTTKDSVGFKEEIMVMKANEAA